MAEKQIEIAELDDAGNVIATYVQSASNQDGLSRVDVILPETTKSIWQRALDVFLPAGYPHSVTSDYMEYQIYDSLQAFSSSIAGLLSSRAVLSSVGVGDASASPTAALLLSILQESAGRIATILFAHRFGTALEPECKMYRLLADVLNDIAFILDCLSPAFPKAVRVIILSFSSVLRALCGVAAGSAKASLSAHFAKWGNLGELNAKDSSQETVISLLGMLVGSLVVSSITTPMATWTTLILLLSIHLETNRRAVRAVTMRTLNRQRATLVYRGLARGHVATPDQIAREESIFERDGVLRDGNGHASGYCCVGVTFSDLLRLTTMQHNKSKSVRVEKDFLARLLEMYRDQAYILWFTASKNYVDIKIVIKKSAASPDLLVAWWQALAIVDRIGVEEAAFSEKDGEAKLHILAESMRVAAEMKSSHAGELRRVGWDLETAALETRSSTRIQLRS